MKCLKPSVTGAIHAKALELRAQGVRVYNFAAGDPIVVNHPCVLEAARAALGSSPYAPVAGLPELRDAAAAWMNRRAGSTFSRNELAVTCGGKFAIFAVLQVLLEPGDEVLVLAPYWVSYPEMVRLAGGTPRIVSLSPSNHWKLTPEQLRSHLTPRTKLILFNNPCNPTGALYTQGEIRALLDAAPKLFWIADEVYSELTYDAPFTSCASFTQHRERVLIVESCSKNFAMAGWRVGFAFGPAPIIAEIVAYQSQSTSGTCLISQRAALAALQHADEIAASLKKEMLHRRNVFFKALHHLFSLSVSPPPSAIYYFAKISGDSASFCEQMLEQANVALIPGVGFGMEGYVRFAITETEEEIVLGLEQLQRHGAKFLID